MEAACCMCGDNTAKYRCPRCRERYCSLSCCKTHKETCVAQETANSSKEKAPVTAGGRALQYTVEDLLNEDEDSDKVSLEKLKSLGQSEELKHLLLNPHLRQLIASLDQTENKDQALKKYMQEPLFVEFADTCLSIVETEEKENIFLD
ncbi:zinc finger HIT domain-containing protein 3 [Hyperolius riggenbachi]|uniref:zinc finger HIT domain-containing protein 3 n=1 Tax=Hyperolius riggenbachi TaxID=752182 RepID=UPI0035A38A42